VNPINGAGYRAYSGRNLYEVFILFSLITALLYLYMNTVQVPISGSFVLLVNQCRGRFFTLVYLTNKLTKSSHLVPALNSYWMKIHVPANFVGYGAFSLAAMIAWFFIIQANAEARHQQRACWRFGCRNPPYWKTSCTKAIALGLHFSPWRLFLAHYGLRKLGRLLVLDPKENLGAVYRLLNYAAGCTCA